jgi:formiminotetrahydrofolate cyclodeaminase
LRDKKPLDGAIRKAIEIPLEVARTAEQGLPLCEKARSLIHAFVEADLGAAVALLTGAIRASLGSVEFNLQQLPEDDPYRLEVAAEVRRLRNNN